jgi:hypothetical protein
MNWPLAMPKINLNKKTGRHASVWILVKSAQGFMEKADDKLIPGEKEECLFSNAAG